MNYHAEKYILEYHDADRYHPIGYRLPVTEDRILLGREAGAAVWFGADFPTVSRRHAQIYRAAQGWVIEPLSHTNSTLVNGQAIMRPTLLRSGDEIRLSTDGPRLGFLLPGGRGASAPAQKPDNGQFVSSPYLPGGYKYNVLTSKWTWIGVAALAIILILIDLHYQNKNLDSTIQRFEERTQQLEQQRVGAADTTHLSDASTLSDGDDLSIQNYTGGSLGSYGGGESSSGSAGGSVTINADGKPSEAAMRAADKNVYFVMSLGFEVTTPEGESYEITCGTEEGEMPGWSGTGFLLSDGRFVTARHVVEPWYFIQGDDDADMTTLNIIASNGGKVVSYIGVVSPTGDRFVFKSSDCRMDRSGDVRRTTKDGERLTIAPLGSSDFATFRSGRSGGLPFSGDTSRNLRRGTRLTVLSFPLGLGANSYNDISPVYGTATVAANGLQEGMILTTETTYERGSSGGPVFITDTSGRLVVVGITSAIAGRSTGFIEPIASIR